MGGKGRTQPRYPWRTIRLGEQFVVAVASRQGAMEQCSRATRRYAKQKLRFVVVRPFPPHGWVVQRVPALPGKYVSPGAVAATSIAEARKKKLLPISIFAHLHELEELPEPWDT